MELTSSQILLAREIISLFQHNPDYMKEVFLNRMEHSPAEVLDWMKDEGYLDDNLNWIPEISRDRLLHIRRLEDKLHNQKKEITELRKVVQQYSRRLDAMHWVWCSGGCESGVGRYTDAELTPEIIELAKKGVARMEEWYGNKERRKHDESKRVD